MKFFCIYGTGKDTEVNSVSFLLVRVVELMRNSKAILLVCTAERLPFTLLKSRRYTRRPNINNENSTIAPEMTCDQEADECVHSQLDIPLSWTSWIDSEFTDDAVFPKVRTFSDTL